MDMTQGARKKTLNNLCVLFLTCWLPNTLTLTLINLINLFCPKSLTPALNFCVRQITDLLKLHWQARLLILASVSRSSLIQPLRFLEQLSS